MTTRHLLDTATKNILVSPQTNFAGNKLRSAFGSLKLNYFETESSHPIYISYTSCAQF
jgi:hypothetical protein